MTHRLSAALASWRGLFLTTVVGGSLLSLSFLGIGDSPHVLTAQFANVDGLVVGNEVRIAGVEVGNVTSVRVETATSGVPQDVLVTMTVDASHWPLHDGTRVAVKPKGVLSNVFLEVDPGSVLNPPLGAQPFFPLSQTQSPVNLDNFTNVFTADVRAAIRTQLEEGVVAFGGTGALDLNQTLHYANPLTADLTSVTDVLATRSPQLDRLNFEFDTVTREIASEDSNLRPLITNLESTFGVLVRQSANLQGTLVNADTFFADLAAAVGDKTTQADLARIFKLGPQSLNCATAISAYLTPLVTSVNPYIAYRTPYSLQSVLDYLVTASGYNTTTTGGINTIRADLLYPVPTGTSAHDTGGLSAEHGGYANASSSGGGSANVYAEQPALTGSAHWPTLAGCTPPAGLP